MESFLIIALIISIIFSVIKVIESKVIDKKYPPVKYIIRDSVIVYCCAFLGIFGYSKINGSVADMMNIITDSKSMNLASTQVFTDEPGF